MNDTVHDLKMPSFGADMTKGTLLEWLVKEGDKIERGAVIAVIETLKGAIDLDIFEEVIIEKLLLKEGDHVAVGTPIARLRTLDETSTPHQNTAIIYETKEAKAITSPSIDEKPTVQTIPIDKDFVLATPAARTYANSHHLSLDAIKASNDQKTITLAMAEASESPLARKEIKTPEASPQKKPMFAIETMRQAISDTVTRSKQEIPHYYLSQRLDITALELYLHNHNTNLPAELRLLLAAPLLCAIARTLMNNSQLNGLYIDNHYSPSNTVNLANAINLRGGGLVMPVIKDAQLLTPTAMMQQLKEQVARARSASLHISEISAASFTVTNIGERGAEQMFAVIYPPQVAIIALGSAHQEARVVKGEIKICSIIEATLAADHRVSDGHLGSKLLYQLNQVLQQPEDLWINKN